MLYNITFSIYRIHQIFHKKLSYTCLPFSSVKICNLFIAHAMKSITKTSQGFNGNYQQAKKKRKSICRFRTSKKKDLEKISKTFRVKNLKNRKRRGLSRSSLDCSAATARNPLNLYRNRTSQFLVALWIYVLTRTQFKLSSLV